MTQEMINYGETDIRFSGGVLMTLLADAEKVSRTPVTLFGANLNVNEANLFLSMIRLIRPIHNPSNVRTLRKQVSQYKNCQISLRSDIPFHEEDYIRLLKERMSYDYYRLMEEAYKVFNAFLKISDEDVRVPVADKVIRSIKEVLALDSTIPDDALFRVQPDGTALTKAELLKCSNINFYSFVIGMFYYACEKIPDNTVGSGTIREWVMTRGLRGRKSLVRSDAGSSIPQDLNISFDLPVLPEDPDESVPYAPILKENQIETLMKYLGPLYEAKQMLPTLMYPKKLTPLYDFYVAPVLRKREAEDPNDPGIFITKPTPAKLLEYAQHLLIVADGGMGKSTVILDMLLQSITNFPSTGILPVFAELKDFQMPCDSLEHYLFEKTEAWWDHSYRAFTVHLERYQTIIFLDGFDEMKARYHRDFASLLHAFIRRFSKAQVIVSSRLVGDVIPLLRMRSVSVQPFSSDQCVALIQKYNYRPDRPELKAAFIKALKEGDLYQKHQPIAQNPLLCTMMLRIFGAEGRIPGGIARFYGQAYSILSEEHDAMKAFERHLYTGLDPKDLKEVLEEVCVYAYSDSHFSFSVDEMGRYLAYLNAYLKLGIKPVKPEPLLADLSDNIPLMLKSEDDCYSFIGNRYFDNYFTAMYMSFNLEGNSRYAIELFERDKYKRDCDHVLDMLYELDRLSTQIHLFLPKLRMVFDKIEKLWDSHGSVPFRMDERGILDEKDRFCCFAYLRECYDSISYASGTVLYDATNYAVSPLLNFILELNHFHEELDDKDMEDMGDSGEDFTEEVFYEYRDDETDPIVVSVHDLKTMEQFSHIRVEEGVPQCDPYEDPFRIHEVGRTYIFTPDLLNCSEHGEIIEALTRETSPYYREYEHLLAYYEELKELEKKSEGNVFKRPQRCTA